MNPAIDALHKLRGSSSRNMSHPDFSRLLHELIDIEKYRNWMKHWEATKFLPTITATEEEQLLGEWDKITRTLGDMIRYAESLYPNKAICRELGFLFWIQLEKKYAGLKRDTLLCKVPHMGRSQKFRIPKPIEIAWGELPEAYVSVQDEIITIEWEHWRGYFPPHGLQERRLCFVPSINTLFMAG